MDKDKNLQPCGHPQACSVVGPPWGPGRSPVHYCAWCASMEHLEQQRRLWKCSAKRHREKHLAFQEVCFAQAELLIERHSELCKLRKELDSKTELAYTRWGEIVRLRGILRDLRAHCSCDPDDEDAWKAWLAMDTALKEGTEEE